MRVMNNFYIKLDYRGLNEMRNSDGMKKVIQSYCERVAQNAGGDGFATDVITGRRRAVGEVRTVTEAAARDCFKNNKLLKALHK